MQMDTKILEAKIHNLRFWVSNCDPNSLQTVFQKYLEEVGFLILNYSDHHFPKQGYTAFWLLAESHLALHTFSDKGYTYVELSSCNKGKSEKFRQLVLESKMQVNWNGKGIEICKPEN